MKGTLRGRSFHIAARTFGVSLLGIALFILGCASPQQSQAVTRGTAPLRPAATTRVAQEGNVDQREQREQHDAQRTWCSYLEALYLRAADHAKVWPKFHECAEILTLASPTMLQATAVCSMQALRQFEGDPFTAAYAAEVSRCGSDAMMSTSLPAIELAPYTAVLCGRVAGCGQVDYETCRRGVQDGLGTQLGRAIGAINSSGRQQLRTCFSSVSCEELGPQISACLEPIMDALLWLPT